MKRAVFLILIAGVLPVTGGDFSADAGGAFLPKVKPLAAYEKLRSRSPFEFSRLKPRLERSDPFEGISLAGYCGRGDTLTVYLFTGKDRKRITVFGDGSPFKKLDDSGFRVVGINRGKSLKTTSIILEKDGRRETMTFEDDILHSAKILPVRSGQSTVRGRDGKITPKPAVPLPTGVVRSQPQPYKAPAPFIPGQTQPSRPQHGAVGSPAGSAVSNNLFVPHGKLADPKLIETRRGNQQGISPAGSPPIPRGRRRVVIPPPLR
jgi:hypothetical protein